MPQLLVSTRSKAAGSMRHGRHCRCTPCSQQDWNEPGLAPCGLHPKGCPPDEPAWRPLLNGEYPPPGPTSLGARREDGTRPIFVYALPLVNRRASA